MAPSTSDRHAGYERRYRELASQLTERQARLYEEWIANDRKMRAIITKMRNVAAKSTELRLKEAADT